MALHFYIVPRVGGVTTPSEPKYFERGSPLTGSFLPYAVEYFIVGADLTDGQHTTLAANNDVVVIPPLDSAVGGNPTLNGVRNALETRSIPGDWVEATTTYRQVIGTTGRCGKIIQRLFGRLGKRLFGQGNALSTTVDATLLADLVAVGASFGVNTSGLSTSMTIRQALLALATQLASFTVAGETF